MFCLSMCSASLCVLPLYVTAVERLLLLCVQKKPADSKKRPVYIMKRLRYGRFVSKDLYTSKETYIHQKRPVYIKKRPIYIKRDLYTSKETIIETYVSSLYLHRDCCRMTRVFKEIYIQQNETCKHQNKTQVRHKSPKRPT